MTLIYLTYSQAPKIGKWAKDLNKVIVGLLYRFILEIIFLAFAAGATWLYLHVIHEALAAIDKESCLKDLGIQVAGTVPAYLRVRKKAWRKLEDR